jgi:hypothetical protein
MSSLNIERRSRRFDALVISRVAWVSIALGCVMGIVSAQAAPLSEADVIRWARAQNTDAAAAREAVAVAEAESVEAGLYPNPQASWDREHFPGNGAEREDSLLVTVPVDLFPRAGARVAIQNGLRAGERIVTLGAHLIKLANRASGAQPHGHIH